MSTTGSPETTYPISDEKQEQLDNNYTYHTPKGDQVVRYPKIRAGGKDLAELICKLTPPSREQSLALTKLEEVILWANAAIARNE